MAGDQARIESLEQQKAALKARLDHIDDELAKERGDKGKARAEQVETAEAPPAPERAVRRASKPKPKE